LKKEALVDCNQIREAAEDYVFGLLEPAREQEFRLHVDSCEACAKALADAVSRREAFSAWEVRPAQGEADRLLARIRSGKTALAPSYGPVLVRILASAAVVLAAVVLPMLFLTMRPAVLAYQPQMTSVEGRFQRQVTQELDIPADVAPNSCIVVRLKSMGADVPLRALVQLNQGQRIWMTGGAVPGEQTIILTPQHGLKEGRNILRIENQALSQLEFEVTLVTGNSK
jgi:hypothetical protein